MPDNMPGTGGDYSQQLPEQESPRFGVKSNFCRCGAWRGDFGLEPEISLYIEHSMLVLDECWRVLRSDGVIFWNLGDSYAGGKGQSGQSISSEEQESRRANGESITSAACQLNMKTRPTDDLAGLRESNIKPKDLCGVPHRFFLAAQQRGWTMRSDIVWQKPNPMPESQRSPAWVRHTVWMEEGGEEKEIPCPGCSVCLPNDGLVFRKGSWRPTDAYELIFMMTKAKPDGWYWSDMEAVKENQITPLGDKSNHTFSAFGGKMARLDDSRLKGNVWIPSDGGRNLRSVWKFPTQPFSGEHFATFPEELPRRCILSGCPEKVCAKCGTGYVRILERKSMVIKRSDWANGSGNRTASSRTMVEPPECKTLGWKAACACGTRETSKGIVLDPFLGSGTVLDVALRSGREGIGIELSKEYIGLAKRRTLAASGQGRLI